MNNDILTKLMQPEMLTAITKASEGSRNPNNDVIITLKGSNYPNNKYKTVETLPNGNKIMIRLMKA